MSGYSADLGAEAVYTLFVECSPHLRRLAQSLLGKRLRRSFDAEDIVQNVWLEVATEARQGRIWACADEVRGFLNLLTRHQVINAARRHLQTQRHVGDRAQAGAAQEPRSRESDPGGEVAAREDWFFWLKQRSRFARAVLHLREQGWTNEMISEATGRPTRRIRKIVQQFVADFLADRHTPPR
jgi:DNA-directed RNA polymerase specialized sigma24 family protein